MLVSAIAKVQQSDVFTFMSAYGVSVEFIVISCMEISFRGFHAHLRAISVNKYYSWTVVFASDEPIHRWLYSKRSYPRSRHFPYNQDIYLSARSALSGRCSSALHSETINIPEMSTRTRSTYQSGRPYSRNSPKEEETSHSLNSSDVSDDEPGSQVLPGQAFNQVELSPVELSETSSTISNNDSFDRRSSSSLTDEHDPDTRGVEVDDQRHSDLLNSSSEDNMLWSSALTARHSIALLHKLCDKLIKSIKDTWSHINEPSAEYITIQGVTNHGDARDPTDHIGMQDPTHPMNALNIQQLGLAYIIKTELTRLEAVAEERVITEETV